MLVQDVIHDQAMEEQASEKTYLHPDPRLSIHMALVLFGSRFYYFEWSVDAANQFIISEVSP